MFKTFRNPPAESEERRPSKITAENKSKQNQVCRANDKTEKKQHAHMKTKAWKHGNREAKHCKFSY